MSGFKSESFENMPFNPADIWCGMRCIRDQKMCVFERFCLYRGEYLQTLSRKHVNSHHRAKWQHGSNPVFEYKELISLSRVYLMTGFRCWYCGEKMYMMVHDENESSACTIDHKVALSLGGQHTIDNVVLCCRRCNRQKARGELVEKRARDRAAYYGMV